jgi:hypothetical protein
MYKLTRPDGFENLRNTKGQFTSEGTSGSNNPKWKNGVYQRSSDGRWMINIDGNWKLRSRVEMEKKLKRQLLSKEIVHHINQDPTDDSISNLELVDRNSHRQKHPTMGNKPKYVFNPDFIRERLNHISRAKLAKELGCNRWVFRRILGELRKGVPKCSN